MNTPTRPLRAHVGLDWTNGHERHTTIALVGDDGYAVTCVRIVQTPGQDNLSLEDIYAPPQLDTERPGWQKAFHRLARHVLRKNIPYRL